MDIHGFVDVLAPRIHPLRTLGLGGCGYGGGGWEVDSGFVGLV